MVLSCSKSLSPAMYGTRSMSSAKMHPAAQLSTPVLYARAPKRSSGGRYHLRQQREPRSIGRKGMGDAPSDDLAGHLGALVRVLARESEIGNLERPVRRDEQVVRLHILWATPRSVPQLSREGGKTHAVQDPVAVAVLEALHGHEHPALDVRRLKRERVVLDDGLEVRVEELEHEVQVRLV